MGERKDGQSRKKSEVRQRKEKQITVKGHVFIPFHNLETVHQGQGVFKPSLVLLKCFLHEHKCEYYYYGCNPVNANRTAKCAHVYARQTDARNRQRQQRPSQAGITKLFRYRDNNTSHGRVKLQKEN